MEEKAEGRVFGSRSPKHGTAKSSRLRSPTNDAETTKLPKIEIRSGSPRVKPGSPEIRFNAGKPSVGLPMLPPVLQKKDKETIQEYIEKKRELLLIQYNLNLKEAEVDELASNVEKEEEQLSQAEKELESETRHFEDFLQHCKTQCQEASQRAEEAIKLKAEKIQDMKRVQSQIDSIKIEILKYEDQLKELQVYETFLTNLTSDIMHPPPRKVSVAQSADQDQEQALNSNHQESNPLDRENFDAHALVSVYDYIRDLNLRLLQLRVRQERTIDGLSCYRNWIHETINASLQELKKTSSIWKNVLTEAQQKASQMKSVLKAFSIQGENRVHQKFRTEYDTLQENINQVYEACVRPNDAKLKSNDLLTEMECVLEELIETVNTLPRSKVVTLQRLRYQQRQELLRRSRLLAAKTDEVCARCQKRS